VALRLAPKRAQPLKTASSAESPEEMPTAWFKKRLFSGTTPDLR
jgi:hypothetical protein